MRTDDEVSAGRGVAATAMVRSRSVRGRQVLRGCWWLAWLGSACGPAGDGAREVSARGLNGARPGSEAALPGAYTLFEADPVRPIAVLEQSGLVAVANTVDDHVHFLEPTRASLRSCGAVQVGMRPVALAVVREERRRAEIWVVNHLSDSISVVVLDRNDCRAEVTRTLQVGDEPRDIVVAQNALGQPRVFVTSAHRGQHHPSPGARRGTDLTTPPDAKEERGLGDVFVFDPEAPEAPLAVVNLFSDKPRALALGQGVVYAASFLSGNRTTAIPSETVTMRGFESVNDVLARDAEGQPIEQGDELLIDPPKQGQAVIAGGLPAVAGSGRCLVDPRDPEQEQGLLRLCAETDAEHRVQRLVVQRPGVVHPSCQCTSGDGTLQPATGVIVQFFEDAASCRSSFTTFPDGTQGCWLDAAPGGVVSPAAQADRPAPPMSWNQQVKFSLPDQDVFAIDVDDLQVSGSHAGVGTVLFGLAVQPGSGRVFVTNTEARNLTRFEGHGRSSSTSVIGHLHESRVTIIDPAAGQAAVQPIHLNTHIDYGRCCEKDPVENAKSFAFPTSGAFSADGERFYFSALGSDKIGVLEAAAFGSAFDHDAARERGELREIWLGEDAARPSGPVALALDARRQRLYVQTHFEPQLVVIDAESERITGRVSLPSPEPESIRRGRSLLYNARLTSSHGDSACASCHVFGDFDGLSWDLGDPDATSVTNPGPFALPGLGVADFRSNKGPMNTQTLRGLANHGPLHWRGDRTRHFQGEPGQQPDFGSLDEASSFSEFDVAVAGLNGNDALLDPEVFAAFTEFALQLTLPPNPVRHLDDTLTPEQAAGRALFFGCDGMSDEQYRARTCVGLHGVEVELEAATSDCACARNPFVVTLRDAPRVAAFAELLQRLLADAELARSWQELASDTRGLPPDAAEGVAAAAQSWASGSTELLGADTALDERGLLSASLAAALTRLSIGTLTVLAVSREQGTPVAEDLARLLLQALPPEALPPELPRDLSGVTLALETLAEVAQLSELARQDELARGTSAFRNLLGGCALAEAAPACPLRVTDTLHTCHGCHRLDPSGNAEYGVSRPGFFGTNGEYSFEGESQVFKVPHLRNAYQKAGMFGAAFNPFFLPESVLGARSGGFFASDNQFTGPQVRGFGFFHDGVVDTLHRFHGAVAFLREPGNPDGLDAFLPPPAQRAACVQRFRQAPRTALDAAPAELRPFLELCVAPGPLPDSCFEDAGAEDCRAALQAAAARVGLPELPAAFAERVLPVCFQLGSMLEGGSSEGVCHPTGLRERAELESFMLAFDSNLKPMVGQQLTLPSRDYADAALVQLLVAARRGDCDLALRYGGEGYLLTGPDPASPGQSRVQDRRDRSLTLEELPKRTGALTFTCHPPAPERAEARRSAWVRRD